MGYNPNIPHLEVSYNPFTNHLLTSWYIQVNQACWGCPLLFKGNGYPSGHRLVEFPHYSTTIEDPWQGWSDRPIHLFRDGLKRWEDHMNRCGFFGIGMPPCWIGSCQQEGPTPSSLKKQPKNIYHLPPFFAVPSETNESSKTALAQKWNWTLLFFFGGYLPEISNVANGKRRSHWFSIFQLVIRSCRFPVEAITQTIHGTGMFPYIYHKNQPNVGKYIYIPVPWMVWVIYRIPRYARFRPPREARSPWRVQDPEVLQAQREEAEFPPGIFHAADKGR